MIFAHPDPATRKWRIRVFTATWLSYAGFYLCRKPFFIAKGTLEDTFGWDPEQLSWIGMAYLVAYAGGQFLAAALGSKYGPRLLLLVGMAVALGANAALGVSNTWGMFAAFMIINGLAQATGWSGNVGAMAAWFARRERGTVMAFWATNFQVGGVAANALAAWALGAFGLSWSFFAGSIVMLFVWGYFLLFQRDAPEDVGLPPLHDADAANVIGADGGWTRDAMVSVALLGATYFFIKFIRYALWSWAPYLLQRHFGLAGDEAGFASTVFDVAGIAGVLSLGILSDRVFGGRRVKISMVYLLIMIGACVALQAAGGTSVTFFVVCLGVIGFGLYGPDAILTSAGAIDIGSKERAVAAAGIINGMGSIGAVLQEFVLGRVLADGEGLNMVFVLLLGSACMATLLLSVLLYRSRSGRADL